MTQKDYIILAAVLNRRFAQPHKTPTELASHLVSDLCEALENDNPRFSKKKFHDAVWKWDTTYGI